MSLATRSSIRLLAAAVGLAASASSSAVVVYSQDFESGAGGFAMTGLWHRADEFPCTGATGFGLYYGIDGACDYDTGSANAGSATSPSIALPSCPGPVTMSFAYVLETEAFLPYDEALVEVSTDGFATSTIVAAQAAAPTILADPSGGWTTASVDLSAWSGMTIQVRFAFDTFDSALNGFLGWFVDDIVIDGPCCTALSLESAPCQDDVHPSPGHQIAVDLWMRDLCGPATGFFAAVEYDLGELSFRPDLSTYSPTGFGPGTLTLIPMVAAEGPAGTLSLASNAALGTGGLASDSLLCTLVFDVLDECSITDVEFDLASFFPSELSYLGLPLVTALIDTGPFAVDDTVPTITCPGDVVQAADVEVDICLASDCCTATLLLGCSDAACSSAVCTADPFCCAVSWDSICVGEVALYCAPTAIAPCLGAVVVYPPPAVMDNCGVASVACSPASGSFFPIGTTTVTCIVTDTCGNTASCDFDVTVTATNLIDVDVVLVGSEPTARCIHFVADLCAVTADEVLAFLGPPGGPASGSGTIEVPCDEYTQLCAKDGQHTKWDTQGLVPAGDRWAVAAPLVLLPGDDDNDGDVDINDVTWVVFTYGAFAAPGGCPFATNTPRDGDFSNNGLVFGEDYSLMSGEFLTVSSCGCASPAQGPDGDLPPTFDDRLSVPVSSLPVAVRAADLTRDGIFDWRDVDEFERRLGLPADLSRRMRERR